MPRILIVEDELPMRTALTDLLRANEYRVSAAVDGVAGLERALDEKPDLVLLDVMMPGLDGFAVCREIRRLMTTTPILMVTAKGQVDDRVTGLDAGADDYLVKPFSSRELLARIRALLRRFECVQTPLHRIRLGEAEIDFDTQRCTRAGERVALTAKEISMLRLLAERRGAPVTREEFLEMVWGYNAYPTTRTVDNQILSLRNKLEPEPANPRFIQTVHGVGYRLEMTEA
ncbi:MAG TPA: response regulator transcription factor [Chthoniobacteraceae bacterium]|nr:response regulator transcription factor [Chthoniobacteraceae bacterium]